MDGWYALPEDIPPGYNVVESGVFNIRPGDSSESSRNDSQGNAVAPSADQVTVLVGPIPTADSVRFALEDASADVLTVRIADMSGKLVWRTTVNDESEIWWDGRTTDGAHLANGPYIYIVAGSTGGSSFKQRGVLFVRR